MPADSSTAVPAPREVAGLWCTDVLALLSDYVDGDLSPDTHARLEAHVADCPWCAEFGGRYGRVVSTIQARLAAPPPVPDDLAGRLDAALEAALVRDA